MKKIDSIIVVGGGTAGCISALMLKTQFPDKHIKIIESEKIGIVGVGESSTEHWKEFCKFVNINQLDAILHCKATFKYGTIFKNWAKRDFMHSLSEPYTCSIGEYFFNFAHLIANGADPKDLCLNYSWENSLGLTHFNHLDDSPTYQYHFDTFALNEFLHNQCKKRNIEIINDDLTGVRLNEETGNVKCLLSSEWEHHADFFIDCSGFSKILLNKTYNIKWKSYSQFIPVNSAFIFQTAEMEEYNKQTYIIARNSGWSWQVPTQTRTGNGYVYNDSFIEEDLARKEMEESYGEKLQIIKTFKFDVGRLEKAWHKNCLAVGLAQSFVEPLEATSIGSIIQQMFCFMHFLPSYDQDSFNKHVDDIFDNILDFIQAHYLVKREDTPFWKEVKYNLNLTPNLQKYLKKWKNRLPLAHEAQCAWTIFRAMNYIPILYGLEWFNSEKIKQEYENYTSYKSDLDLIWKPAFSLGHKELIQKLVAK